MDMKCTGTAIDCAPQQKAYIVGRVRRSYPFEQEAMPETKKKEVVQQKAQPPAEEKKKNSFWKGFGLAVAVVAVVAVAVACVVAAAPVAVALLAGGAASVAVGIGLAAGVTTGSLFMVEGSTQLMEAGVGLMGGKEEEEVQHLIDSGWAYVGIGLSTNMTFMSFAMAALPMLSYMDARIAGAWAKINTPKTSVPKQVEMSNPKVVNSKLTVDTEDETFATFRDMMSKEEVERYDKYWEGVAEKISNEAIDKEIIRMNNGEILKPNGSAYYSRKISAAVDMDTGDISLGYAGKKGYNPSKPDYMNGESLDPKLQQKIDNTKNIAMNDVNNIYRDKGSYEEWAVDNCAEVFATDKALKGGADINSIFLNTKTVKTGEYAPSCDNCKITFKGFLMPKGE